MPAGAARRTVAHRSSLSSKKICGPVRRLSSVGFGERHPERNDKAAPSFAAAVANSSPPVPAQADDETLYGHFAASRDAEVFAELVRRYQSFAYRVAFCVCTQAELAEEAVQEAFVQLAREDAGFRSRGEGSFRAWFYRLVTLVARTHLRSERRNVNRVKSRRYLDEVHAAAEARFEPSVLSGDRTDDAKSLAIVRAALGALVEDLRTPVVMHYIEGLSKADVARAIGVSAAQVTRRIAKGLEALRHRLAQDGASLSVAALPGLLGHEALLPAPHSLRASLAHLNPKALGAGTAQLSLRRATAKGMGGYTVPAILALSALAGGALWWTNPEWPEAKLPPKAVRAACAAPAPNVALAPAVPAWSFERCWSFDRDVPQEFLDCNGEGLCAYWRAGKAGAPGALHALPEVKVIFRLPVEVPKGPLQVTIVVRPNENGEVGNCGTYWVNGTRIPPREFWWTNLSQPGVTTQEITLWFWDRCCVQSFGDDFFALRRSDRAYPSNNLFTWIVNCNVERIAVRSVTLGEIPARVRAFDELARTMQEGPIRVVEGNLPLPVRKLDKSARLGSKAVADGTR